MDSPKGRTGFLGFGRGNKEGHPVEVENAVTPHQTAGGTFEETFDLSDELPGLEGLVSESESLPVVQLPQEDTNAPTLHATVSSETQLSKKADSKLAVITGNALKTFAKVTPIAAPVLTSMAASFGRMGTSWPETFTRWGWYGAWAVGGMKLADKLIPDTKRSLSVAWQRIYGAELGTLFAVALADIQKGVVDGKLIGSIATQFVDEAGFSKVVLNAANKDNNNALYLRAAMSTLVLGVNMAVATERANQGDWGTAALLLHSSYLNLVKEIKELPTSGEQMAIILRDQVKSHYNGIEKEFELARAEFKKKRKGKNFQIEARFRTAEAAFKFWEPIDRLVNPNIEDGELKPSYKEILETFEVALNYDVADKEYVYDKEDGAVSHSRRLVQVWNHARGWAAAHGVMGHVLRGEIGLGKDSSKPMNVFLQESVWEPTLRSEVKDLRRAVKEKQRPVNVIRQEAKPATIVSGEHPTTVVGQSELGRPLTLAEKHGYRRQATGRRAQEPAPQVLPVDAGAAERIQQAVDEAMVIKPNGKNGNGHEGNGHEGEVEADVESGDSQAPPSLMQRLGNARTPARIEGLGDHDDELPLPTVTGGNGEDDTEGNGGENPPDWRVGHEDFLIRRRTTEVDDEDDEDAYEEEDVPVVGDEEPVDEDEDEDQ